ncbi:MAG: nicotinamide mononucleotide transporter [Lysobacterales bacterium]|jgi:nicotinamide mononucleotide transporter
MMSQMFVWEVLAVILAVAYLVLAIRQIIWCWVAAAASTIIYLFLMYKANLYMESALQVFYLLMAGYGWFQWRKHSEPGADLKVTTWPLYKHLVAVSIILLLMFFSGNLLTNYTDAALPHLDSFTTWGAVVATYMVTRKILENWLYWFVIDAVSVGLYTSRGLYLTAILFTVYLVMIVFGYRNWRASMKENNL